MKIETHLDWNPKRAYIKAEVNRWETFNITISGDSENIEIDFDWDHGYDGRGSSAVEIPKQVLIDLIKKV